MLLTHTLTHSSFLSLSLLSILDLAIPCYVRLQLHAAELAFVFGF